MEAIISIPTEHSATIAPTMGQSNWDRTLSPSKLHLPTAVEVHLKNLASDGSRLVSAVAAVIFLLILVHAVLALRKFPGSYRQYQQFHQHMGAMRHPDTTLWYLQVVTGFAMFFLASAHLFVVFLQPDNIGPYASSDRIWSGNFWILYALLLITTRLALAALTSTNDEC